MIIIDSREPPKAEEWFKEFDIELKREMLDAGDYIVSVNGHQIAAERKEVGDFISSITDGRLNNQLYELSKNFELSYLFIIGDIVAELAKREINPNTVYSAMVGASLKRAADGKQGIIVTITLPTNYEMATCLYYLHKKLEEGKLVRYPYSTGRKNDYKACLIRVYSSFPGIGEELAKRLAEKFPTLSSLINASVEDLKQVYGISDGKAKKIIEFIRGL
jgi:ERCC4-type nuclease